MDWHSLVGHESVQPVTSAAAPSSRLDVASVTSSLVTNSVRLETVLLAGCVAAGAVVFVLLLDLPELPLGLPATSPWAWRPGPKCEGNTSLQALHVTRQ